MSWILAGQLVSLGALGYLAYVTFDAVSYTHLDVSKRQFQDCFKLKGAGYGATQPVNVPLLRLDRVFCTPPLKPERAATVLIPDTCLLYTSRCV